MLRRILFTPAGRVRTPWRLLLFLVVFGVLLFAAHGALDRLDPPPVGHGLLWSSLATLAAALVAGMALLGWVDGRPPGALGYAWTWQTPREIGGGVAIGAVSLVLVVGAFVLAGLVSFVGDEGSAGSYARTLLLDFGVLAVAAAAEEALFRGYPFQALVQGTGPVIATVLLSALFAAAHLPNPNLGAFALLNIFLAGVLLSVAYLRTRSLWLPTAVHLGWNWAMASPLDLPVSGLEVFDTPLYEPSVTGPDWITGGAFGPEGGIGASIAFLLALAAVRWLPLWHEPLELRARGPLVDDRS
ncbi:MAG: CPBP family intramembrane metalloprotease [Gemmatimonadetes bacterium]|nr:CPBP family intramembrane metalloprotease [Gemmatimonadota bacterium]